MKAAPFKYYNPTTLEQALNQLAQVADEGGRVLAGGQTLVPMMALRVAYPGHLVDINGVTELERAQVQGEQFVIGALARHAWFYKAVAPGELGRIMQVLSQHIAHHPVRTRGTFCGSLAHSDPASEWALLVATLEGTLVAASVEGTREIAAADYFQGALSTALQENELLQEVRLPLLHAEDKGGFYEFNRRAGDFALGMSLCVIRVENNTITAARVGLGAVEEVARRIPEVEQALLGQPPSPELLRQAAALVKDVVDPFTDAQTPVEYKRDLAAVVIERALKNALYSK